MVNYGDDDAHAGDDDAGDDDDDDDDAPDDGIDVGGNKSAFSPRSLVAISPSQFPSRPT